MTPCSSLGATRTLTAPVIGATRTAAFLAGPPPTPTPTPGLQGPGRTGGRYLDGLAVVDFDHVEVKAVDPFTRSDEITSLLVEILPHVDENLKEGKR